MSKCGEVVQEGGVTVCEYTYICIYIYIHTHRHTHTHIYIYSTPNDPAAILFKYNTVTYSVFEHYTYLCLPPGKGSTCFIANMKHTAHQKHLNVCLANNLKVFPLDR